MKLRIFLLAIGVTGLASCGVCNASDQANDQDEMDALTVTDVSEGAKAYKGEPENKNEDPAWGALEELGFQIGDKLDYIGELTRCKVGNTTTSDQTNGQDRMDALTVDLPEHLMAEKNPNLPEWHDQGQESLTFYIGDKLSYASDKIGEYSDYAFPAHLLKDPLEAGSGMDLSKFGHQLGKEAVEFGGSSSLLPKMPIWDHDGNPGLVPDAVLHALDSSDILLGPLDRAKKAISSATGALSAAKIGMPYAEKMAGWGAGQLWKNWGSKLAIPAAMASGKIGSGAFINKVENGVKEVKDYIGW